MIKKLGFIVVSFTTMGFISCGEKSTCPAANKLTKVSKVENNTPFGTSLKVPFFNSGKREKKKEGNNFVLREQKNQQTSGNLFSSENKEKSFHKPGNLFATEEKDKAENNSGNLFSSAYKEKKTFGPKGKEGRKKKKRKRKWKLFKIKSAEEKNMEIENHKLFKRTNEKEVKNRQRKIKYREEGLFPKGVTK